MQHPLEGTKVGTIWIDYFLRTGLGVFTAAGRKGYVSEKAEGEVEKIVSGE
jgi:hypothetical protein